MTVICAVIFFLGCRETSKEKIFPKDDTLLRKRVNKIELWKEKTENNIFAFREGYIPDEVEFCDEKVPLNKWWVRQKLQEAIRFYAWFSSGRERIMTYQILKSQYFPSLEYALRVRGIPDDLKYIPVVESEFSLDAVSPVGAQGAWQFMPYVAEEMGLLMNDMYDERLYFEGATEAALMKLSAEHDMCFENWILTIATYNAGYGRVTRAVRDQGDTSFFNLILPQETILYVYRMIAVKLIMEHPERYGFAPSLFFNDTILLVSYETNISKSIIDCAREFGISPIEYKLLNPQFIAGVIPRGKFTIRVPLHRSVSYKQETIYSDSLHK